MDSRPIIPAPGDGTSLRDMPGNWQVVPAQAGQSRTPCATRPDRWVLGWGRLRARGVHSLNFHDGIPIRVGSAREGFTRSGRHRTGRQHSAPRARGVHPVRSASDGSATVGSASEKGSRRPEGLTRVVRLDAGSCDTPATGCHALRTLMSRGEGACHKRVRVMSLAHAGWALARSVVTRDCLRVTGS